MRMSIQEYFERLEAVLEPLDRAGVCELVRNLAKGVPVEGRPGFLQKMSPKVEILQEEDGAAAGGSVEEGLARLLEEIRERVELIENGEYDQLDDWDYEDYNCCHDEEPDYLTSDHEDEIKAIAQEADDFFLDREFDAAARTYRALIRFAAELNRMGWGLFLPDARVLGKSYCQAVSECSPDGFFPEKLFESFVFVQECLVFESVVPGAKGCLFLQEVFSGAPFLEDATFLKDWENQMEKHPHDPLGQMLKVEVALLRNREAETFRYLATQKREEAVWGWFAYILFHAQGGHWDKVPSACRKLFPILEEPSQKVAVGEWMQQAGGKLDRPVAIAEGIRYRFAVYPSLDLLGQLIVQVSDQTILEGEWIRWVGVLEHTQYHRDLDALLHLFLGDFKKTCPLSRTFKAVGWSNGSDSAVLVSAIWMALCNGEESLPAVLDKFLFQVFSARNMMFDDLAEAAASQKALKETLRRTMAKVEMVPDEKLKWLEKTRKVVEMRVEAIVSNKYRKAYGRATDAVVAWCAVAKVLGREREGREFVAELLHRYNRFSAFKRELNQRVELQEEMQDE